MWEVSVDLGRRVTPGRGCHRPRRTRQVQGTRERAEAVLAELLAGEAEPGRTVPRFALAPLEAAAGPVEGLAAAAGFRPTAARRWRARGLLTLEAADRLALAAGLHPANVWPDW